MPDDQVLRAGRLVIPLSELDWRFSRSGGPGGQHANTSDTRVELVFDIESSPSLTETDRSRLMDRLGTSVRVVAGAERSQRRNRAAALERLEERLCAALRRPTARRPTRPTRSAVERRLQDKRRRAQRKSERRRPDSG